MTAKRIIVLAAWLFGPNAGFAETNDKVRLTETGTLEATSRLPNVLALISTV